MLKLKKISLVVLIIGYMAAGVNHFRVPGFYIQIIPKYFPDPEVLNILAGCCEIGFAILLIFATTREFAAWGIVFMLIAFIPVHLQMILDSPYKLGQSVVSPVILWIRLIVMQPLLIWWAWWYTEVWKKKNSRVIPKA
jgi:uncharacterized membrane protein